MVEPHTHVLHGHRPSPRADVFGLSAAVRTALWMAVAAFIWIAVLLVIG
jgi:hypothetical protein